MCTVSHPISHSFGHRIICVYMEFGPCLYLHTHILYWLFSIKQCWNWFVQKTKRRQDPKEMCRMKALFSLIVHKVVVLYTGNSSV